MPSTASYATERVDTFATNKTISNDVVAQRFDPGSPDIVSVHEINAVLALAAIDVALTTAAVVTFLVAQRGTLCAFGKSQAIPLVTGIGLLTSAVGARATGSRNWLIATGVFSTVHGFMNPFRAYLGCWYHFLVGEALPFMPERHVDMQLLEEGLEVAAAENGIAQALNFDWLGFLSITNHLQASRDHIQSMMAGHSIPDRIILGVMIFCVPGVMFAAGVAEFGMGLHILHAALRQPVFSDS